MRKFTEYLKTPTAALLLVGLVVAIAVGLTRRHNQQIAAHERLVDCHIDQKLAPRPVTHGKATVAVLGDGLADGFGLPHGMTQAWPALLGATEHWTTIVNGDANSGFVAGGFCGHQRFAARISQIRAVHPALVVVEGGTSDVARAASVGDRNIEKAFRGAATHVLSQLAGVSNVVVVGPLPSGQPPSTTDQKLDSTLAHAAAAAGARYVSALHWKLPSSPNGDQADARTQAAIAANIKRSLPSSLG